jgi:hypothetical protein
MVTPDDHRSVAIMIVPPAMQPAVVVELYARAAIGVAVAIVIIAVAANAKAEALRARHCGRCNRDGR